MFLTVGDRHKLSSMDKQVLRQQFLAKRQALTTSQIQIKSQQICENIQAQSLFQTANTVLSYAAFRQEPDLQDLLSLPKNWGLPRCVKKSLIWHHYRRGDPLESGKFGILEPHPDLPLLDWANIDLILVPALACSQKGDRLGYGAGFYDRFLANLPDKVITIGIVFDCCFAPTLPADPWDIPLDYVCTEKRFYAI